MLRFTRPHESSSMVSLDPLHRATDQLEFLNDAARSHKGMIALLIPLASGQDHEKAAGDLPLSLLPPPQNDQDPPMRACAASLVDQFIRLRRRRDTIFGIGLFADPAWDMLLDLFLARERGLRPISTSSLCIAAAVPATTALRRIDILVRQGLLSRHADPKDGRRVFIRLTDMAWHKMQDLLRPWAERT
jgi:hypothetical protein